MIANSSPPRTTPLTPFNSSPFSRGSRAVHQGLKKAKAGINTGKDEADIDMGLFSSKDGTNGGNECNSDKQTKPESPTSSSCDPNLLTPSSRGILKRRREAEMDSDEAVSCSKKKVIFASPISVSKIIDNVLAAKGNKTIRRRKLKYEDSADETSDDKEAPTAAIEPIVESISETETLALNGSIHENSENSEPDNNAKQLQTVTRRTRSSTAARGGVKTPSNPHTDSPVEQLETNSKDTKAEANIPNSSDIKVNVKTNPEVISQDANDTEESDIIFKNIESLLMKMESSSSSSSDTPSSVGYFKEKFVSLNSVPDSIPDSKPTDNDLPKKGNKISCLLTPSNFEFDLNCIPRLDPSQIIPKASIVIKRLTEELINRLLGKERNQEKATNQRNKQDYLKLIVVSGSNRKQKRN